MRLGRERVRNIPLYITIEEQISNRRTNRRPQDIGTRTVLVEAFLQLTPGRSDKILVYEDFQPKLDPGDSTPTTGLCLPDFRALSKSM